MVSSDILHVKDSYFFEVPKFLWPSQREDRADFPGYWIRLDPDYQDWEAGKLHDLLVQSAWMQNAEIPAKAVLIEQYRAWRDAPEHFAKPFTAFLEQNQQLEWFQNRLEAEGADAAWSKIKNTPDTAGYLAEYKVTAPPWPEEKIERYNRQLDGRILIPQPLGTLKNNYEAASGFCISRFMIIELIVALILCVVFIRLARWMRRSDRPRGKRWNLLEAILLYFRDEVVRRAVGERDASRFTPLLWTIFLFVLGCNLFGLVPWMGAPTSAFGVTLGLAAIVFVTGLVSGIHRFGLFGYLKNLVPKLGLPWYLAIPIVPLIFLVETLSLVIKHAVLGIRLLANMAAGHLVQLAIISLAASAAGSATWGVTATVAVIGSVLLNCLELFIAFLQAYVFTFLSALFIGAAIHSH